MSMWPDTLCLTTWATLSPGWGSEAWIGLSRLSITSWIQVPGMLQISIDDRSRWQQSCQCSQLLLPPVTAAWLCWCGCFVGHSCIPWHVTRALGLSWSCRSEGGAGAVALVPEVTSNLQDLSSFSTVSGSRDKLGTGTITPVSCGTTGLQGTQHCHGSGFFFFFFFSYVLVQKLNRGFCQC